MASATVSRPGLSITSIAIVFVDNFDHGLLNLAKAVIVYSNFVTICRRSRMGGTPKSELGGDDAAAISNRASKR